MLYFQNVLHCINFLSVFNQLKVKIFQRIEQNSSTLHIAHFRNPCGEILLNNVKINGKASHLARKTYNYKSLKESGHRLVKKKGFEELYTCNHWRNRSSSEDILSDVYNGNIWKDFNGRKYDFFTEQRYFGLMLNVALFQPFKYSNYSVGAVYQSILNLPREERFKRNNIILVGILPDFKTEPPTNTFLKPLVDELQEAWEVFICIVIHPPLIL